MPIPGPLPQSELMLTLADAETCLKNAGRLSKDARKTSPGTRLALREAALEEIAKASMIVFRAQLQASGGRGPLPPPGAPTPPGEGAVFRLLWERRELLSDANLRAAFRWHPVKLEYVEFLLDLLDAILEDVRPGPVRVRGAPIKFRFWVPVVTSNFVRPIISRRIRKFLSDQRSRGILGLDGIAKRGLYVDLTDGGRPCKPAEADPGLLTDLWTLNMTLSRILSGQILHTRLAFAARGVTLEMRLLPNARGVGEPRGDFDWDRPQSRLEPLLSGRVGKRRTRGRR